MLKKLGGEDQIRSGLKYFLDRYLAWRASGSLNEPPLIRVENQDWIGYHKGALVMYLLQKRMGEDAVNRALRNLLQRFRFKDTPYPRSPGSARPDPDR